jgi:predicted nucleotidyltransferase
MLSDLLGMKVDLVTSKGLKPQLRQNILDEVVYL